MVYRVDLTDRANRDLSYLYAQIDGAESSAAALWFNGWEEAIDALTRFPRRCPVAPEGKKANRLLRHLLYGNKPLIYRVVYEVDESRKIVNVLTIRHGAMDETRPDELNS